MMVKIINLFLLVALITLFSSCGGSKGELVLEDETAESLLQKSNIAYENGDYDKSIQLAQTMLDYFPISDLHIDAQLQIAENLGAKEKYEDQFDLLLRILKENIIPERVPIIYMQIGEFYENSAKWNPGTVISDTIDYQKAANYYKKAVFYPNSDDRMTKVHALYRMALMHAKVSEIEIASKAYQELIATFPESPYSTLARTKLNDPTNTDELMLPTIAAPEAIQPVATEPASEAPTPLDITEDQTITPVTEEPAVIDLPKADTEETSILDSLQTMDEDSSEFDD